MTKPFTTMRSNFKSRLSVAAGLVLFFVIAGVISTVCFNCGPKQSIILDSTQKKKTVVEIERLPNPDVRIPSTATEPEVLQVNSLRFVVDPREELLSIVLLLSDYDPALEQMTKYDFDYKREIATTFHKYKDHDAVKIFNKLWRINFTFDAPPTAMLYLTNDFRLREDTFITNYLKARAGSEKVLLIFFEALRRFNDDSHFTDFFNSHRVYYRSLLRNAASQVAGKDSVRELEAYYGAHNLSYTVMLVSLFRRGGYGPRVERAGGSEIYAIIGSRGVNGTMPSFGTRSDFLYIVRHEFGHSFANPIVERNWELARRYAPLYEPIRDTMQSMGYGEWKICLNEHIVRAVTIRLAYIDSEEQGRQTLEEEKRKGFRYVGCLTDRLIAYEKNRHGFPALENYFPVLLAGLDKAY